MTRYIPPAQLSEVVDALTCLQENIKFVFFKPEGLTSDEVESLIAEPCEAIIRDLRAAMATHAACMRRAEELARAQLVAETTAFLHATVFLHGSPQ
jgi:hypothetical protein